MGKSNQQIFSVAAKYKRVAEILDIVPNKSEFICQAILEKFEKENGANPSSIDLREQIKKILEEMTRDNIFIVKGSGSINTLSPSNITPTANNEKDDVVIDEKRSESIEKTDTVSDETKEVMRDVLNSWVFSEE